MAPMNIKCYTFTKNKCKRRLKKQYKYKIYYGLYTCNKDLFKNTPVYFICKFCVYKIYYYYYYIPVI